MNQNTEEMQYGYYSQQQFQNMQNSSDKDTPYIYYKDKNDKIVQITEVTSNPNFQTRFNDIVYLGELKRFHCVSSSPINLHPENAAEP